MSVIIISSIIAVATQMRATVRGEVIVVDIPWRSEPANFNRKAESPKNFHGASALRPELRKVSLCFVTID